MITGDAVQGQRCCWLSQQPVTDGVEFAPVWGPSGSMIAFASSRSGSAENHEMREDRSRQRRLIRLLP